jgi:flavin reductase (DIM6/NTAB) family NADH-FMN oxidoreductase RutF
MRVKVNATDPQSFRTVMGRFATGVTIVTYLCDGQPSGLTANGFLSVSLRPPLVLVCVRRESRFTAHVRMGSSYGVNLLAEHQQDLSAHFGGRPDQLLQPRYRKHDSTPLIEDCLGYIVATVTDIHPAGDHVLYIAEIAALELGADEAPLIFFGGRYKRLLAHAPAYNLFGEPDWL